MIPYLAELSFINLMYKLANYGVVEFSKLFFNIFELAYIYYFSKILLFSIVKVAIANSWKFAEKLSSA